VQDNVDRAALLKNKIIHRGIGQEAEAKGLGTEACQVCPGHLAVLKDLRRDSGEVVPFDLPEFHFQGSLRQLEIDPLVIEFDQCCGNLDLMKPITEGEVDEVEMFQAGLVMKIFRPKTAQIIIVADLRLGLDGNHVIVFVVPEMDGYVAVPEVDAVQEIDQAGAGNLSPFCFTFFDRNDIGEPQGRFGCTCFHVSFDDSIFEGKSKIT